MATYNFDNVELDPGDLGIHWVEGVGFRPVDITEEYAAGYKGCGFTEGAEQCHRIECQNEKWTPPLFAEPPIFPPATIYPPLIRTEVPPSTWWTNPPWFFYSTTTGTPKTSLLCCTTSEDPPRLFEPPTTTGTPEVVPLPPSILMVLTAVLILRKIVQ